MPLPSCTDYINIMETPELIRVKELKGGYCERSCRGKIKRYSGGFCIVFPFLVGKNKYAIRCWHANVDKIQERTKIVSDYIKTSGLPYFVDFQYHKEGIATQFGLMPIVVMDWISAKPLKEYIKEQLYNSNALNQLARNFYEMTVNLHQHNISHGDLQHGNILVTDAGKLMLVDYDSVYVPGLDNFEDDIKGLKGYQHPSRWKNKYASPKADYFSEIIIYSSIMALSKRPQLWDISQMSESEYMLFTEEDIEKPLTSIIFSNICSDEELKPLGDRILEFLNLESIEDLLPLEQAVTHPRTMSERLSEAWMNSGYKSSPAIQCNPNDIKDKWEQVTPSIKQVYDELVREVSKKW